MRLLLGYVALRGHVTDAAIQNHINSHLCTLLKAVRWREAKNFLLECEPSMTGLSSDALLLLLFRMYKAAIFYFIEDATRDEQLEALSVMEDTVRRSRRVSGIHHPKTEAYDVVLQCMRQVEGLYALPADPEVKAKGMAETLLVMRKKIFQ